ncbi:MAG: N-acyl-L-amino acid amidohydrolase [Lysobacteraceae bacterium]|nr:MAG: N-acyl-L-amino acid amidohydrolase [Xanthomonadaceae bacterium]
MRILLALALLPALAQAQPTPTVEALARGVDAKVLAWRRDIHQHPELSNRETRTAALVARHLRALGLLDVRTGLAHHGVSAVLRGARPGPRIALRADMDALPVTEAVDLPFASRVTTEYRGQTVGVMHACGHDAHTAILLGVAEALAGQRERLAGEILFVFQPAEEGAPDGEEGGASLMLKEGLFERFRPEAMFGLHVWSALHAGHIGYRSGPFMAASDSFRISVIGRQTHGSRPWGGVDPIAISALLIASAQQVVSRELDISTLPVVLSFGAIDGGIRNNIIPDRVDMIGTIRTFDEAMRQDVFRRLARIAEHTAAAHGARVEMSLPDPGGNPVTVNDPALTARMLPSLRQVAGKDRLHELGLVMGAEDFSYYAREVPALFFFVGATPPDTPLDEAPSNHSPHFFLDEEALRVGLRAMLQLVSDYGLLAADS